MRGRTAGIEAHTSGRSIGGRYSKHESEGFNALEVPLSISDALATRNFTGKTRVTLTEANKWSVAIARGEVPPEYENIEAFIADMKLKLNL